MSEPKKPPESLSRDELARLGRMARDNEREEWLRDRNRSRWERVKSWAVWVAAIGAAKGVLWEPLKELLAWVQGLLP